MTSSGGAAEIWAQMMGIYEKEEGLVWTHSGLENGNQIYALDGHWRIGVADRRNSSIESTTAATLPFESSNWRYYDNMANAWTDDDITLRVRASGPY